MKRRDTNATNDERSHAEERRTLLASAAKFATVVAGLGLTGLSISDLATATESDNPLTRLLEHAVSSGDMEAAIEKYGDEAALTDKQLDVLRSLSEQELRDIETVRDKLENEEYFKSRAIRG